VSDKVIPFPSKLHDGEGVAQVLCQTCGSRAMRLVGFDANAESWDVECHNCGNEQIGLRVQWLDSSTT
jgi:hypothetical protein